MRISRADRATSASGVTRVNSLGGALRRLTGGRGLTLPPAPSDGPAERGALALLGELWAPLPLLPLANVASYHTVPPTGSERAADRAQAGRAVIALENLSATGRGRRAPTDRH